MDSVPIRQTQTQTQVIVNSFVRSVYNWMAIGLALTGFVAYFVANSQTMQNIIFGNPMVFYGLITGELVMVFYLTAGQQDAGLDRHSPFRVVCGP